MKAFLRWPGLVFAMAFGWNLLLFLLSAQPVPANDAFFYDGAVVNFLLHGNYVNPSLALALPISGTKVFSAYPPLYQSVLLGWMKLFGTSALTAMALHLVLFGVYLLACLAILRRLQTPVWCLHIAGAFGFVLTFHDRPDSLAHVFGMLAVYVLVRSRRVFQLESPNASAIAGADQSIPRLWAWQVAVFLVLALASSLQIGLVYLLMVWVGMTSSTISGKDKFPLAPMLLTLLVPAGLVAMVVVLFPELWSGFQEHARQTPSLTGLRWPRLDDFLKIIRTVPGLLAVSYFLAWSRLRQRCLAMSPVQERFGFLVLVCVLPALLVVAGCLVLVTPNMVAIAGYLQPLAVGAFLAFSLPAITDSRQRMQVWLFAGLAALGSIRAIGMTTWGLACAADVGYSAALQRVQSALTSASPHQRVVLSSAFLYEAAKHDDVRSIHSDWLHPSLPGQPDADAAGLLELKPTKLILTQFDYYRRYRQVLSQLQLESNLAEIRIENIARIQPPDAFESLQRVVQHISWAPIIVSFEWKP